MPEIKVYSTKTCVYCKQLKDYLKSKNIKFEEILLDEQEDKIAEFMDTCGSMAVPCTHIKLDNGEEVKIIGFDQPKLSKILGV